jgi:hypothetical protein
MISGIRGNIAALAPGLEDLGLAMAQPGPGRILDDGR